MIPFTDQFPAVTVVVPSGWLARYVVFEISLAALHVPSQSHLARNMSANIALNCNEAIRMHKTKYYWFMDDDHQFDPPTLLRLVAHDLPVVVPITCLKQPPFLPVVFKEGRLDPKTGYKQYVPYTWKELDDQIGLIDVHACGRAGMLVRRDVFEALPEPWFRVGQTNPEYLGEDMFFCEQLRERGIPIKADTDLMFGHIDPVAVWPMRVSDGTWRLKLVWGNGQTVILNRNDLPPAAAVTLAPRAQRGNRVADLMKKYTDVGLDESDAFTRALEDVEREETAAQA